MTADSREETRDKCFQAGMNDYIQKPVELPQLEAALKRALAGSATAKSSTVIDPIVIAGLRQLGMPGKPSPVSELINLFLHEAPLHIEALANAAKQNNETSLVRIFS